MIRLKSFYPLLEIFYICMIGWISFIYSCITQLTYECIRCLHLLFIVCYWLFTHSISPPFGLHQKHSIVEVFLPRNNMLFRFLIGGGLSVLQQVWGCGCEGMRVWVWRCGCEGVGAKVWVWGCVRVVCGCVRVVCGCVGGVWLWLWVWVYG